MKSEYEVKNGYLFIEDEELGIHFADKTPFPKTIEEAAHDTKFVIKKNFHGKKLVSVAVFLEDVKQGEERRYLDDGTLFWQGYFLDGKLHGPSCTYFPNGDLASSSWYINGKKEGKCSFYRKDKTLFSLERYRKGQFQGFQEYCYPNGSLKAKLLYEGGFLEHVLLFYPDGKKRREITLKKAKRQGSDLLWEESGVLRYHLEYEKAKCIRQVVQDPIAQHYEL
jgi:antitoxin component YwqK of YwqJK toxin-antitoxin module